MVKTSVIVPVFNTAPYLKECFDSIFSQTQKELEVIAINDGSTDGSLSILREIQKEHPELIIFSQENKGPGDTRNQGIELASGEFIYFLDSDDCIVDTAMDTCYNCAKTNGLDIVMFDAQTFGDIEGERGNYDRKRSIREQNTVINGGDFANRYWLKSFCPTAWLMYFSVRFLKEQNLKFLSRVYYEDNEFYCKAVPLAERVMYIPEAFYKRRYRKDSITLSSFDQRHAEDFLMMIKTVCMQEPDPKTELVIHEIILKFLQNLAGKCRQGRIFDNDRFADDLFTTALHICGGSIENIESYPEIETLHYIVESITNQGTIPVEMRIKIQNKKRELMVKLFSDLPLQSEGKYVGIYGTGKNTDRFLNAYQENVARIKANVIPIDSSVKTGEKQYWGWDIFNVDDIAEMPLECIAIASSKYEEEINQMIREKYGTKFKVIRLSSDLHF